MRRTPRIVLGIALVVAAATLGLTAVSLASSAPEDRQPPGGGFTTAAVVPSAPETHFVPVDPCRIADTRAAGGAIAPNTTRTFQVAGTTNFAPQGGKVGGCGVPTYAVAAAIGVISVGSSASSHLSLFPAGSPAPTASTLNFSKGVTGNVSAIVKVRPGTAPHLAVRTGTATTHVVLDVTGFYVPALAAAVNGDGTLISSTATGITSSRITTGAYAVVFTRDITHCAVVASSTNLNYALVTVPNGPQVRVYINTENPRVYHDSPFQLTVTC